MSKDETIVVDGPRVAAQILNRLPGEARSRIVEAIRSAAPESAVRIEQILLNELKRPVDGPATSIAAIAELSDKDIQKLLREVDSRDLVATLKAAPKEAQEKVLQNLSQSRQQQVVEEMHDLPTPSAREIEAANTRILKKVDSLYGDTQTPAQPKRLRSRLA
jgi:flagellar motor switch protein FliG